MALNTTEVVGLVKGHNGAKKEFSFNLTLGDVKHLRRVLQYYSKFPTLESHHVNEPLLLKFRMFGVRTGRNKDRSQLIVKTNSKCSIEGCTRNDLTADHIVPLRDGGSNQQSNLRVLCRKHHDIVEYERSIDRLTKKIINIKSEVLNGS